MVPEKAQAHYQSKQLGRIKLRQLTRIKHNPGGQNQLTNQWEAIKEGGRKCPVRKNGRKRNEN